jgi:putative DNA methylase
MMNYPKRLIEVDLPIKEISAHARREKSIRHGHISTLHIWWARRPLAACRAVICAALWPDPADDLCPQAFRDAAARVLADFAEQVRSDEKLAGLCAKHWSRWKRTNSASLRSADPACWFDMRYALLDFIADFANWDASAVPAFRDTAGMLTQAAHEALGGAPGTRPLLVDPFAGGGAIPLEALRVGADAFASDLNPVAVLLNKVVLEYIPKYGQRLTDEVRKWGAWIKEQAEAELAEFYPNDPDGSTPIAYLWARTIRCEGPGCGAEIPLMRSLWLAKKGDGRSVALRLVPEVAAKSVNIEITENASSSTVGEGTIRRGSASCPVCGFTTPVASVRRQLKEYHGGAADARLLAVVTVRPDLANRVFRLPTPSDIEATQRAVDELARRKRTNKGVMSLVPDEPTPQGGGSGAGRAFSQRNYGMNSFGDLFTPRQALALSTLSALVNEAGVRIAKMGDAEFARLVQTCLALGLNRVADRCSSLCRYDPSPTMSGINNTFARQTLPIVWDFGEGNPINVRSGGWSQSLEPLLAVLELEGKNLSNAATVAQASAFEHPLPDDSADIFFTDPPYYDAVPYSDLSDFFYVWLKRSIPEGVIDGMQADLTPKRDECIVDEVKGKDRAYFESAMQRSMREGRRVLKQDGIGTVVFAHKSTTGWEAQLQAMMEAGWVITGSWPIDTEMGTRLRAHESAALASSIHLVCRPRPDAEADQSVSSRQDGRENVGDWRQVLAELPARIHAWMPRLAQEGVVGADAIFACLGPALEIFSRYSRVEKASGDQVTMREYLEHVWAAVSREALTMIFAGADATGFEEDARLTAMWLWTLTTDKNGNGSGGSEGASDEESDDEDQGSVGAPKLGGYYLEYDAARKIAQGLGAHLERLTSLVEVKGGKARLLPVAERARHLFGKDEGQAPTRQRPKPQQLSLLAALDEAEQEGAWGVKAVPDLGNTVLDRIHQSMILFAAGRAEALRQFLVDEKVGTDQRFWRLANALSALYPPGSDEKRWVDGVLARKKGLGF